MGLTRRLRAVEHVGETGTDVPLDVLAPDFVVGYIEFESGVAARLTRSIISPHDHRLRVFGDDGVLSVPWAK